LSHSLAAKKRAARMNLKAYTMGLELIQIVGEAAKARGVGLPRGLTAPCWAKGVKGEVG
jgi:hypothetical protein